MPDSFTPLKYIGEAVSGIIAVTFGWVWRVNSKVNNHDTRIISVEERSIHTRDLTEAISHRVGNQGTRLMEIEKKMDKTSSEATQTRETVIRIEEKMAAWKDEGQRDASEILSLLKRQERERRNE